MSAKNNLKILLVDDEPDVLDVIGNLLEMENYEVSYARDYYDALAKVDEEKFDLVITDYRMPKMHGIYLLDMIKDGHPELPVILITAYSGAELMAEAKRKGADAYIAKPFTFETLDSTIKKVMRKWQKRSGAKKP